MSTYVKKREGVTLIETLIAIAIMAVVMVAVYQLFNVLFSVFGVGQMRRAAAALANQQIELIRNMNYSEIGTIGGSPPGFVEPTETKSKYGIQFNVSTIIRNIDDSFDGSIGGVPNDTSPGDYKLIELTIQCSACNDATQFIFTARAGPQALENASTNGSLFVRAINASGEPIAGANVHVTNNLVNPNVNISDVTDANGFLKIIDLLPSLQSYHIVVSKTGYSSDQTYAATTANPNPVRDDATVALQTVTQATFSIDQVSTMNLSSVNESCAVVPNINASIIGAKLIGTNPNIPKFTGNYITNGSGLRTVSNLEWDAYQILASSTSQIIRGVIPLVPLDVLPNTTQDIKLIMQPKNPDDLLVTVRDGATGLPLSDASVHLIRTAGGYDTTLVTGRGFLRQSDWSGGSGQSLFTDATKYFDQDGNIDTNSVPGELRLTSAGAGTFVASGVLTSSVFDTGSATNFFNISWNPLNQPPGTGANAIRFQLASATTTSPTSWQFLGPDGTTATYYTSPGAVISSVHNGDRYIRYRVYLQTGNNALTPNLSDVAITFGSSCVPPGQVLFSGLTADTYDISVSRSGYTTINDIVIVADQWQELIVDL